MANIFDFATKELSQDAFVRWIAESYIDNDRQLSEFSIYFLSRLIEENLSEIKNIETFSQYGKERIDIVIYFETTCEKFAIAIEDKTLTSIHDDQLNREYDFLNKDKLFKNCLKKFVYYKTSFVGEFEKKQIEKNWKIFDIDDIVDLFNKFLEKNKIKNFNNIILQNYYEYVTKIKQNAHLFDKDETMLTFENGLLYGNKKWERSACWQKLFENFKFNGIEHTPVHSWTGKYWYRFIYLEKAAKDFISVEIRSSELKDNRFSFKFVVYHISNILETENKKLTQEEIKQNSEKYIKENLVDVKDFFTMEKEKIKGIFSEYQGYKVNFSINKKQWLSVDKYGIQKVSDLKNAVGEICEIIFKLYKEFVKQKKI